MADVSRYSDVVTNTNASPKVLNSPTKEKGKFTQNIATITYVSGDSAPSLQRILRIPSNARVAEVRESHTTFTAAGAINVGLHYIPGETPKGNVDGAEIDADFFAAALDLNSVTTRRDGDITNQSTTNTQAKQQQPIWQAVGLSADPKCDFHLTATVTTTINSTELAVHFKVEYVL